MTRGPIWSTNPLSVHRQVIPLAAGAPVSSKLWVIVPGTFCCKVEFLPLSPHTQGNHSWFCLFVGGQGHPHVFVFVLFLTFFEDVWNHTGGRQFRVAPTRLSLPHCRPPHALSPTSFRNSPNQCATLATPPRPLCFPPGSGPFKPVYLPEP